MPHPCRVSAGLVIGVLTACGAVTADGDPNDGKNDKDDPPPPGMVDAGIDAPAITELKGLGQQCELAKGGSDCPANAPICLGFANTTTFCTPTCLSGATGKAMGTSAFINVMPLPANSSGLCAAAYSGTQGVPLCGAVYAWSPMDNPLVPDKMYTGIAEACIIECGTNRACPATHGAKDVGSQCMCLPL
jgi:hypothetical protein